MKEDFLIDSTRAMDSITICLQERIDSLQVICSNLSSAHDELNSTVQLYTIIIVSLFIVFVVIFYKVYRNVKDIRICESQYTLARYKSEEKMRKKTVRETKDCKDELAETDKQINDSVLQISENNPIQVSLQEEETNLNSNVDSNEINETKGTTQTLKNFKIVKYVNIQAPDQEGTLKIAERTMQDTLSETKPFIVEYDEGAEVATYTINSVVAKWILKDLQTYKDFFKPFTIDTNTATSIKVVRKGSLVKSGKFWIVKDKLEVMFN